MADRMGDLAALDQYVSDSEGYRQMLQMEQDGMDPADRPRAHGQGDTLDAMPNYSFGNTFKSQLPHGYLIDPGASGTPPYPFNDRARWGFDT